MIRGIFYKEWLKTRWVLGSYLLLLLVFLAYVFVQVNHDLRFVNAARYWNAVVYDGYQYYGGYFRYLVLLLGTVIAAFQFVPETHQKRLKLTLHLPLSINRIISSMLLYGVLGLALIMFVSLCVLGVASAWFFPWEIVRESLLTQIPWWLGSFGLYGLSALVLIEQQWKMRLFFSMIWFVFLFCYSFDHWYGIYSPSLGWFLSGGLFALLTPFYATYRFKRGEM